MTTKTTGWPKDQMKTMVTNNKADVAKHKLSEGAAREPMYKVKQAHNGIREYLPADYDNGMAMYD